MVVYEISTNPAVAAQYNPRSNLCGWCQSRTKIKAMNTGRHERTIPGSRPLLFDIQTTQIDAENKRVSIDCNDERVFDLTIPIRDRLTALRLYGTDKLSP